MYQDYEDTTPFFHKDNQKEKKKKHNVYYGIDF